MGDGAALDGLYAETWAAVADGDARCVGELQEYVEEELRRDPTFYGAASEAIATNRSEGFAPRDAYEARVEIVSPAQGARTAARSDTLAFTWRLAGAPFGLGVAGAAWRSCVFSRWRRAGHCLPPARSAPARPAQPRAGPEGRYQAPPCERAKQPFSKRQKSRVRPGHLLQDAVATR